MALYPAPRGCAGHRVWRLCGEPPSADYLRAFRRLNVLDSRTWNRGRARLEGQRKWRSLQDDNVVVFGRDALWALGLPRVEPLSEHGPTEWGVTWRYLPHPSGRCHWYSDALCWRMASTLLTELMEEGLRDVERN